VPGVINPAATAIPATGFAPPGLAIPQLTAPIAGTALPGVVIPQLSIPQPGVVAPQLTGNLHCLHVLVVLLIVTVNAFCHLLILKK